MNILYEQFPEEVKVNGEYYPIVTDFREWIRFTELVEDDSVPWRMKCGLLLQWYLDQIPDDIEAAIYALGDFLMCKRMYQDDLEDEEEEQQKNGKPVFSFSEDAGCIYAAFREAYGIDLQQIDYMHWWEFRSLDSFRASIFSIAITAFSFLPPAALTASLTESINTRSASFAAYSSSFAFRSL